MGRESEIKFVPPQQINQTIPDIVAGYKSYSGLNPIFLKPRLFERLGFAVVDFKVGDIWRSLPFSSGIQSGPQYHDMAISKLN